MFQVPIRMMKIMPFVGFHQRGIGGFFVRHCYFTGGDDPYDRLKRTLKAEINAEAWETLYRTESRSFPTPVSGRIAVKVINDYGDEVMKVFDLS